ncbi:DUF4026 domain-containing protein [Aminipila butyrica]|uniref:DUF4026 domain-containing protein n=1 Tax=Aminipila butyrica TaxID=433296 RepID=A0A858BWX0_9FIRM|nr:DUF4026 domain-containing protein [Aminipila butyrica]QIB70581.1 DUF4026 domain-containing protein [Aminipila butyrica]
MRDISHMLAVPVLEEELMDLDGMMTRLSQADGIQICQATMEEEVMKLRLQIDQADYSVELYPTGFQVPELYRSLHAFPDVDIEALQQMEIGLAVEMTYGADALASYHAQLRIIHALLPEKLAVFDDSSEKILSGRWAALAASSKIPPAPRYIYTVQAVSDPEDDLVWLHSHGLNRCGITELEVLHSSKAVYQSHYSVMEMMANRLLEMEEPLGPLEPLFLAHLTSEESLVGTLVPWEQAVELYAPHMLGGKNDREESHNGHTSAIFVYPSYEDFQQGTYGALSLYDEHLAGNPIYMLTTGETKRMKALALERLEYMQKAFGKEESTIQVKLGLEIDEAHRSEDLSTEHIWFEVLGMGREGMTAKLTQEPYYIADLHKGDTGQYPWELITDWAIYTPERRITPDDVYLLESK